MKKITYSSQILLPTAFLAFPLTSLYAQEDQDFGELDASEIIAEQTEGFSVSKSESLRYGGDIQDSVETIQVITSEVIEAVQANKLDEALEFAGGVVQGSGFGGTSDSFSIRGFGASVAENGIVSSGPFSNRLDLKREAITVERVEVLRGSNGALFGEGSLGGVVNIVTKQPEIGNAFKSRTTTSSEGLFLQEFDANTSFGDNDQHQFRFFSSIEDDNNSFRDNTDSDQLFFSGNYDYEPSEDLRFSLSVDYTEARTSFDRGVPVDLNGNLLTGRSVNLSDPDIGDVTSKNFRVSGLIEAQLNEDWKWTSSASFFDSRLDGEATTSLVVFQEDLIRPPLGINFFTNRSIVRGIADRDFDTSLFTTRHELKGNFETGSLKHKALFGLEYRYLDTTTVTDSNNPLTDPGTVDLLNPVIDQAPQPLGATNSLDLQTSNISLTAFDQISINDSFNIVLGGRVDFIDSLSGTVGGDQENLSEIAFSPTVGASYRVNDQTSVFARYSESFIVNTVQDTNEDLLDPQEGTNIETGVRFNLLGDRLNATTSYFHLEQDNRPISDSGTGIFESGTLVSQGFDFTLQGKITDNLSLVFNYTYNDTEITESTNEGSLGSRESGIPLHQASLFANYSFNGGDLDGLSLTAGLVFVGERLNSLPTVNVVDTGTPLGDLEIPAGGQELDSYIRFDAGARYKINDNATFSVKVENVFDINYERSTNQSSAVPEAPRTVFASLELTF